MSRKLFWLGALVVAVVVLLTYAPATKLNFYADDYSFLEKAGRSSLPEYLAFYFDPRVQTGWYRPLQGIYLGVEYLLFGSNPFGYHLFNMLVHLANCLLLWAIVWRVLKNRLVAFLSSLVYAGLPLYGVAVFWPGDADFFLTFFYLLALFFWLVYLQESRRGFYLAALVCFWFALLTKEFGATLPLTLGLADRLIVRGKISPAGLARRYAPFAVTLAVYLPLEYSIQSRSVLTGTYDYSLAGHSISNLVGYLAVLVFPWGLPEPASYAWLAAAALAFVLVLAVTRSRAWLFLLLAATLAFLPVVNFPWFFTRYLYLSVMASAIVLAVLIEAVRKRFKRPTWVHVLASTGVAMLVLADGLGVAGATADFAELGRQSRVPFRDISQQHPAFPDDTYLYFIDAPSPISEYSGMFFLRYGAGIHVSGDSARDGHARLLEHKNAYVVYFDEQRRTREIAVDGSALVVSTPAAFEAPLTLAGYEMPATKTKRGDAFALISYWQATRPLGRDYAVLLQLVDAVTGRVIQESDAAPHGIPVSSSWKPDEVIVDARALLIPDDTPTGTAYRLQVRVYDPQAGRNLRVIAGPGLVGDDSVTIQPVVVE